MEKPTIPKGTRDFGPAVMGKRQFIFNTIRAVYQKYGFQPLETPSMENLSVLTGKYGDEGDQLLFKILDSGDFFSEYKIQTTNPIRVISKFKDFIASLFSELHPKNYDQVVFESSTLDFAFERVINQYTPYKNYFTTFYNEQKELLFEEGYKFYDHVNSALKSSENLKSHIHDISEIFNSNVIRYILINTSSKDLVSNKDFKISEKGLRYDLTVPFARYVVMNRGEITFPFKRYQIQPVWRADRPQKGRYREFYQCDADVVGTTSLLCEAEIVMMIREVMKGLGIADFTIKINHRGVLAGLAEIAEAKGKEVAFYTAIDKLDKIGEEKVREELVLNGFTKPQLDVLFELLNASGSNTEKLTLLNNHFTNSSTGAKGINDLKQVIALLKELNSDESNLQFDVALARGLSYYTGCIFEVKINNVSIGSVSGGGRYDNLTQSFGDKESLSGVGISFGVDRLYDVLEELKLFPKETQRSSTVLICHVDEESMRYGLKVATALRTAGIASEVYPDESKLKKQLDYANKKMIPYAIVIGEEERKEGLLMLKNMDAGTQEKRTLEDVISILVLVVSG